MAMVINSNIQSLNAQRHLNNSLDAQNTATERLSSGLRINSAKDDAAGLAIANRMTSQIQGLDQAIRNANDGAALIQTAEGGLEEMTNILQRMRELSIQSANGTYDSGNRNTINAEVDQLKAEIDRIAETTSFNGQNILDGKLGQIDLQVGENANQTIAINIDNLNTKNLGGNGADLVGSSSGQDLLTELKKVMSTGAVAGAGQLEINGDAVAGMSNAASLNEAVQTLSDSVSGVDVSYFVEITADAVNNGTGILQGDDALIITLEEADASGTSTVLTISDTSSLKEVVAQINEKGGDNVKASIDDNGRLVISSENHQSIAITGNGDGQANTGFLATGVTQEAQLKFTITDSSIKSIDIEAVTNGTAPNQMFVSDLGLNKSVKGLVTSSLTGTVATSTVLPASIDAGDLVINGVSIGAATSGTDAGTRITSNINAINKHTAETGVIALAVTGGSFALQSVAGGQISIEAGTIGNAGDSNEARETLLFAATGLTVRNEAESVSNGVAGIDLTTAAGAQKAIAVLDEAIQQVSEERGELGAISNRLDYTTRNLANISENASSAKSSIMDADFAAESANLSRAQVLQQAGNAMLAQANARPQQVLSLLQ